MPATRTATLHDADTTGLRAALWAAALLLALGAALAALGWGACGTRARPPPSSPRSRRGCESPATPYRRFAVNATRKRPDAAETNAEPADEFRDAIRASLRNAEQWLAENRHLPHDSLSYCDVRLHAGAMRASLRALDRLTGHDFPLTYGVPE